VVSHSPKFGRKHVWIWISSDDAFAAAADAEEGGQVGGQQKIKVKRFPLFFHSAAPFISAAAGEEWSKMSRPFSGEAPGNMYKWRWMGGWMDG
jgi:hypothetical protein